MSALTNKQIAVLKVLKKGNAKTIKKIAEALSKKETVTTSAVRDRLSRLEFLGLVTSNEMYDKKINRIVHVWELTNSGRAKV